MFVFAAGLSLPFGTNCLFVGAGDEGTVVSCAQGLELFVPGEGSSAFGSCVAISAEADSTDGEDRWVGQVGRGGGVGSVVLWRGGGTKAMPLVLRVCQICRGGEGRRSFEGVGGVSNGGVAWRRGQ